ncbi:unnamed protein product [Lymnaea stagnalis]|uniref:Uncharacterized protein n=1 Tax=Lymnaea stagnalis TaxID=6523 RepID=A0AAV2HP12_LYMST
MEVDDGSDAFATVALASCVAIASVLVVLTIFVATWLLQRHSSRRETQNPSSMIVISQASRELEVKLTSHFCMFLGELFQTEVACECPAMDSGDTVNLMTTNDNSRSSLLRRGDSDGGNYLCAIHLLFSYSTHVNYEASTSVCLLNQNSNSLGLQSDLDEIVFKGKSPNSPKTSSKSTCKTKSKTSSTTTCKTKSKTSSGLNTVVALFTNDRVTIKSISPFADALTNDEQITVMEERFCHSSSAPHDAQSMYNRPDLCPVTTHGHYANVYYLPWQMMDLCKELCHTFPEYKNIRLDGEGVLSSSLWVVIRGLHDKASENQPSKGGVYGWIREIPDPVANSTLTLCSSLLEPVAPLGRHVPRLPECDETMASNEGSFSNLSEAERQLGGSQRGGVSIRSFECPASAGIRPSRPSCPDFFQLHGEESMTGSCPDLLVSAAFPQPLNGEHSPASHIPDDFKAHIVPPTL